MLSLAPLHNIRPKYLALFHYSARLKHLFWTLVEFKFLKKMKLLYCSSWQFQCLLEFQGAIQMTKKLRFDEVKVTARDYRGRNFIQFTFALRLFIFIALLFFLLSFNAYFTQFLLTFNRNSVASTHCSLTCKNMSRYWKIELEKSLFISRRFA